MPAIELNDEQTELLREYLRRLLSDLSVEIAGTDRKAYREEIKAERNVLREIADVLDRAESRLRRS